MVKVSVIVPVYNAEPYLAGCLDGLIKQTLQDIEIICVDNCSKDKSVSIIKEYQKKDNRIQLIESKKNCGQCHSLILGLEKAKGEYIGECDADDRAAMVMYEELYNLAKETDADICQGGFSNWTIDRISPYPIATKKIAFNPQMLKGQDRMDFIGRQPHIMSAIYRRSFISKDLWYRDGKDFEDTSLCFKHRTTAKVYALHPDCMYFYRRDNESSGTNSTKNFDGIFEQFQEVKGYIADHKLKGYDECVGVWKYYTYMWALSLIPDGDYRKTFIDKAKKDLSKDKVDSTYFLGDDFENFKKFLK